LIKIAKDHLSIFTNKLFTRRLLDRVTGRDRAGKVDKVDALVLDDLFGNLVSRVEDLEDALGETGLLERLGKAVGAEERVGRLLEDDRVAREDGRDDAVDGDEVGVVPYGPTGWCKGGERKAHITMHQ